MIENPTINNDDKNLHAENQKEIALSLNNRGSISALGEVQITPDELIARHPDLYGKPSVCQKF